jgi:hypothetical protein
MDKDTSVTPGRTVDIDGGSPRKDGSANSTDLYAGLLAEPSTGTYGNGAIAMTVNFGDSQIAEAEVMQVEIMAIHPQSSTPYDLTTAFAAGDHVNMVVHQVGKVYWLKGSSISATKDQSKLIPAGAGLVKVQVAHTATPLPMHMWKCRKTVTSATWVKGTYLGIVSTFTA